STSTEELHHRIVEAHGIPLAAITAGGNRNDVTRLIPLIQAAPLIRGKRGQPLRRPRHPYADRGFDHEVHHRDEVRRFQLTPHLARRGSGHGYGLGVYRWVVEGAIVLLHWFRRLRIRWDIRDDIHHAFLMLTTTAH
ncbi:IS5/IS1182 family transposase, partial [Nonomuraea sp. RK-328]|nr:IS5/IS1182 family transposase [Nonomuraea sp. RK-328]